MYSKFSTTHSSIYGEHGQIMLIILLVIVVVLTIGLSLASRSVITVKTTSEEYESQKAFSAAEAGVENALKTGQGVNASQAFDTDSQIKQVSISQVGGNDTFTLNNGDVLHQDDGLDVWLSDYTNASVQQYPNPRTGTMHIFWGKNTDGCSDSALEIIVFSNKANPVVDHYGFDACSSRRAVNNLRPDTATALSYPGLTHHAAINVTSGLFMRVIPLYSDSPVGVIARDASNNPLSMPTQGQLISSTGSSGNTKRKITYFQTYQGVPTEFLYSIFSVQ